MTGIDVQTVAAAEDRLPDGVVVLRVTGEIDMVGAPALRRAAARQVAVTPRALILDLSGVSFLAAAGVGALAATIHEAGERGVAVRVVASERAVLRVLELTGIDRLVPVHATAAPWPRRAGRPTRRRGRAAPATGEGCTGHRG